MKLSMPKGEPEITLSQRSDGRFEVARNGYVLHVSGTYEQCQLWLHGWLNSRKRYDTPPAVLYRAVLRTK